MMDDDGWDVFFSPLIHAAAIAAPSLCVRINGNKRRRVRTADCVGSLAGPGTYVRASVFVCEEFVFPLTGARRSCLRVGACLPRSEAGAPGV